MRHVQSRHQTGTKRFPCPNGQCRFKATRKDHIRQHVRNMHSNACAKRDSELPIASKTSLVIEEQLDDLSALIDTSAMGNVKLTQYLIDNGANIAAKSGEGSTPLHCAARGGHSEVVKLLLHCDMEVDERDEKGRTALQDAIISRDQRTIQTLVHAGANLRVKDTDGRTVLQYIVASGDVDILRLVIRFVDIGCVNELPTPLLHIAARAGHILMVKFLLDQPKTEVDKKCALGYVPLHHAARYGNVEVAQVLLSSGANVNLKRGERGYSALHYAARYGQEQVVALLLSNVHLSLDDKDCLGHDALRLATEHGHSSVERLLEKH